MNINPNCKLEKIVHKGDDRGGLNCIKSFGRHLCASDGKVMAFVKTEKEDGDTPGLIPAKIYAEARKGKTIHHINITAEKISTPTKGGTLEEETPKADFPNVRPFYKKAKKATKVQTLTIGINARFLHNLAEALGSEDGAVYLHFTEDGFGKESNDYRKEITVTLANKYGGHETKNNIGIIMPIKKETP